MEQQTRTHHCGELGTASVGEKVRLTGWVQKRRDLGGLIFIDLRDRSGRVQVVCHPEVSAEAVQVAEKVRREFVLGVEGTVVARAEDAVNPNMETGKIEIECKQIEVINEAKTPPLDIEDHIDVDEMVRLKYRYLDLRRPEMQKTLVLRHRAMQMIRSYLDEGGFLEVETPILTKSTPEGARDYLVPSRVQGGNFFALPQSPQMFKQLLMVAGLEKYFQITRCFRDEDLRADRQPEFTQVDIEASFLPQESLLKMMEEMMMKLFEETIGAHVEGPFLRLTHQEAMDRFGTDKPDMRYGMELRDLSGLVHNSGFKVFATTVAGGGQVKAINVKGCADWSRKVVDGWGKVAQELGAKGLAWLAVRAEGNKGPVAKFLSAEEWTKMAKVLEAEVGDMILFVADKPTVVAQVLGEIRTRLAKELDLIPQGKYSFLWVTDFPLLSYDEEEGRYFAEHHPFTMPVAEDVEKLTTDPGSVRAQAYDLVLNGYEIGGGSQRIYRREVQEAMFTALGFTMEEAYEQFGFFLEAFEYGAPPHGGIALGFDRIVMLLAGRDNLRDCIAFPKTNQARCLLTHAPTPVDESQLNALAISLVKSEVEA
ncbi:aspartate--tRNA ligase [Mechercharimyces sp. CAU 1602]|uniref:aspartate--tRNA ligase n=1 Tax=Mechercharimyces sp. CAU 1602 TaxID=2973933 RepID=UPI002163F7BA|nr:aspartate--tRNA ligase [Mechercharimyces sp. CAU 1602]MCS1350250.1 aspartate--tRNA ligase [Mechercharimyces sp. CAU 1602]